MIAGVLMVVAVCLWLSAERRARHWQSMSVASAREADETVRSANNLRLLYEASNRRDLVLSDEAITRLLNTPCNR
jgi:hypothetical protein